MPERLVFLAFLTILGFTSQPHCFLSLDFVITRLGSLMMRLQVQQPNKQTLIPLSIDIECSMKANFVQLSRSRSSSYVIKRPRREHIIELNWKTTLLARLHFQFVMFWLNLLIDNDFSFEGINSAKKEASSALPERVHIATEFEWLKIERNYEMKDSFSRSCEVQLKAALSRRRER